MNTHTEERLTWDEITARYPDRWVLVADYESESICPKIKSGIVLYTASTKREMYEFLKGQPQLYREWRILYTGVLTNQQHEWKAVTILSVNRRNFQPY